MIGTRLGPYEIVAKLGEGGMGEVYRATDLNLKREVAIKVLPVAFTADKERLSRFEREAQLLAQLNHPNIAQIYGLEASGEARALVMELVPGPTLAERLEQGPLPLNESLSVSVQIAQALEEAHEKGIVHRDLKPQNVKASIEGKVKVLDFGLAKAMDPVGASSGAAGALAHSPTLTLGATQLGVILGTAAYMSPEQAKGSPVDKRADIWAFGVVLYEMLVGRRLFAGESVAETIAGVLKTEIDFGALPAGTPLALRRLLHRCLERNPKNRLHDISDARLELEEAMAHPVDAAPVVAQSSQPVRARASVALFAIAALVGAAVGALAWQLLEWRGGAASISSGGTRLSIVPPANLEILDFVLSPDGRTLALSLRPKRDGSEASRASLYLRSLDRFEPRPVPESEGFTRALFSADSRWLYFVAPVAANATQLRLARVPVEGSSSPVTLRPWESGWESFTLLPNGDALVTLESGSKFVRLPADGAAPSAARPIDGGGLATTNFYFTGLPLPDGSPLMGVSHYGARGYQEGVVLLDPTSGKVRLLADDAAHGVWLPSGQLVFGRGDALLSVPLEAGRAAPGGTPRAIFTGVRTLSSSDQYPRFELSGNGTLVFAPGGRLGSRRRMAILDPAGVVTPWSGGAMSLQNAPSTSANGRRFAQTVMEPNGLLFEIWVSDLEPPALRRWLSVPGVDNGFPVMAPDGSRIAYRRVSRSAEDGIYVRSIDGQGGARRIATITSPTDLLPSAWSPDGTRLLATRGMAGRMDIVQVRMDEGTSTPPVPLDFGGFDHGQATVSPDGKSLAYLSNESGTFEVYAARWLEDGSVGPSVPVSRGPAAFPRWRADGKAIVYYDERTHLMSASVATAPRLTIGPPQQIADIAKLGITYDFDVLPEGRLLVLLRGEDEGEISRLDVITDFDGEIATTERAP